MTPDKIKEAHRLIGERDGLIRDLDHLRSLADGDLIAYERKPELVRDRYGCSSSYSCIDYPRSYNVPKQCAVDFVQGKITDIEGKLKEMGVTF